jgi:polyhydroxybutyrate depolymerase
VYERKAEIGNSCPDMNRKRKKIILGVLAIIIGLPVALVVMVLVWTSIADKTNGAIVSSGVTRRYLLYVPKTYDRSRLTPLVITMHGGGSWPAAAMYISRWNEVAEQHGFIVVYPAGSSAFWGGFSPGPHVWPMGPRSLGGEVRFISDLIDKLEAEYNIDPNRIYADGMSNGGGMALALSCRLSDRIAAVGAVASGRKLSWDRCGDSRPVPMVAFHGTADLRAPYRGGRSSAPSDPVMFPDIRDWTAHVARRNQCKGDPSDTRITANVRRLAYTNCAENADVVLYSVEGGGHTWPGWQVPQVVAPEWLVGRATREINATRVMWEFFVQHPRGRK